MKVLIATSGGGGHFLPALHVARFLRDSGHEVTFIGTFASGEQRLDEERFPYIRLRTIGWERRNIETMFRFLRLQISALVISLKAVKHLRPDIVLGFGGFASVPPVLAARMLKRPCCLHEQNVVPGKATRFLFRWVKHVAISFPQSKAYFPKASVRLTGYPCMIHASARSREEVAGDFALRADRTTLFIFGGSLGSRRINAAMKESAPLLKRALDFQVIHVAGESDQKEMADFYRNQDVPAAVFSYLTRMADAYRIADVVISRAGAGTISEIALLKKKAVLIPYPHADGHQRENALSLCKECSAVMIEEDNLTAESLKQAILAMCAPQDASESRGRLPATPDEAEERIVKFAMELIG